jgi:hypothetical protein
VGKQRETNLGVLESWRYREFDLVFVMLMLWVLMVGLGYAPSLVEVSVGSTAERNWRSTFPALHPTCRC